MFRETSLAPLCCFGSRVFGITRAQLQSRSALRKMTSKRQGTIGKAKRKPASGKKI
jgi:hypothetical protein